MRRSCLYVAQTGGSVTLAGRIESAHGKAHLPNGRTQYSLLPLNTHAQCLMNLQVEAVRHGRSCNHTSVKAQSARCPEQGQLED